MPIAVIQFSPLAIVIVVSVAIFRVAHAALCETLQSATKVEGAWMMSHNTTGTRAHQSYIRTSYLWNDKQMRELAAGDWSPYANTNWCTVKTEAD